MTVVSVRYSPVQCPANTATKFTGQSVGGFLCTTSGTIAITNSAGTTIVPTLAVTAGLWVDIPLRIGDGGGTITTAGGAVGVLGVV